MINVFFDCEMTHLWDPVPEPPGLISIGCISEDGRQFYAENGDYPYALCNAFVRETVIPLLEGRLQHALRQVGENAEGMDRGV